MTESANANNIHSYDILVVDDNAANLGLVATGLDRQGYRVRVAESGEKALERVALTPPNLILLDVMMPGTDGFETCRRLKAQPETSGIPIIFMTALTDIKDKLAAFEAGAVDYVTKPLQIDEVVARVGTQLELDAMRKRLKAQNAELATHRDNLENLVARRTAELEQLNHKLNDEIEERRVAQEELAAREQQFRTLAENLPDNVARYNLECRAVYANPPLRKAAKAFSGRSPIGKTPTELLPGNEDALRYQSTMQRVMQTGTPEYLEITLPYPPGEISIHQMSFVAERRGNGAIRGTLVIGRDITVLKETERQLKESNKQIMALAQRRETAREEERIHISRELHDDLGQYLTALSLHASALNIEFAEDKPAMRTKLELILSLVNRTKKVARNLSRKLRPVELDMGIEAALHGLVDQFSAQYGINCQLRLDQETDNLPDTRAAILYRVVQESLTNIARHAEANNVEIVLQCRNGGVTLKVSDDGKGFDPAKVKPTSFGLVGMQERLLAVGGEFEICNEPHNGTRVIAHLPPIEMNEE